MHVDDVSMKNCSVSIPFKHSLPGLLSCAHNSGGINRRVVRTVMRRRTATDTLYKKLQIELFLVIL